MKNPYAVVEIDKEAIYAAAMDPLNFAKLMKQKIDRVHLKLAILASEYQESEKTILQERIQQILKTEDSDQQ